MPHCGKPHAESFTLRDYLDTSWRSMLASWRVHRFLESFCVFPVRAGGHGGRARFPSFSCHRRTTMTNFPRIERLPPYVFNITGELKMAARRRGEDIIDMSMGNPDGPTPKHIVDKLIEVASRPNTHGYSVSKGIPRLRRAISGWYQRRYNVAIDPDLE